MDRIAQLSSKLSEVGKMKIRMSLSEDALVARYYEHRSELSGSHFHGGTVEDGIEEMRQVRDLINYAFQEGSKTDTFGRTWAF